MQNIGISEFYELSGLEKSEAVQILKQCFETGDWTPYDNFLEEHSKKVLALQEAEKATKNMTKVYVVMEAGLEYNDEIYYQQGWENLGDTAFLTVQEARENAKGRLKHLLSEFPINAFTYDFNGEIHLEVKNWLYDIGGSEDTPWTAYIEACEENGVEWVSSAPEFVVIKQIEVNGTLVSEPQQFINPNPGGIIATSWNLPINSVSAAGMFTTPAIFTNDPALSEMIEEEELEAWSESEEDLPEEEGF